MSFEYKMFREEITTTSEDSEIVDRDVVEWANAYGAKGWEFLRVEWGVRQDSQWDDKGQRPVWTVCIEAFGKKQLVDHCAIPSTDGEKTESGNESGNESRNRCAIPPDKGEKTGIGQRIGPSLPDSIENLLVQAESGQIVAVLRAETEEIELGSLYSGWFVYRDAICRKDPGGGYYVLNKFDASFWGCGPEKSERDKLLVRRCKFVVLTEETYS